MLFRSNALASALRTVADDLRHAAALANTQERPGGTARTDVVNAVEPHIQMRISNATTAAAARREHGDGGGGGGDDDMEEAVRVLKSRRAAAAMREQRRAIGERIRRHMAST